MAEDSLRKLRAMSEVANPVSAAPGQSSTFISRASRFVRLAFKRIQMQSLGCSQRRSRPTSPDSFTGADTDVELALE